MLKARLIAATLLLSIAVSAPSAFAKTMTCPACHMPMPTKKTATMNVPVYSKADKTVYYCCSGCAAGKKAAAYYKVHHKPMPV